MAYFFEKHKIKLPRHLDRRVKVDEAEISVWKQQYTKLVEDRLAFDINDDGWIDQEDLERVQEIRLGLQWLLGRQDTSFTLAEVRTEEQRIRGMADTNADGTIDAAELAAYKVAYHAGQNNLIGMFDFDLDGKITENDLNIYKRVYQDPQALNLNGTGTVDASDVARLGQIINFVN